MQNRRNGRACKTGVIQVAARRLQRTRIISPKFRYGFRVCVVTCCVIGGAWTLVLFTAFVQYERVAGCVIQ